MPLLGRDDALFLQVKPLQVKEVRDYGALAAAVESGLIAAEMGV